MMNGIDNVDTEKLGGDDAAPGATHSADAGGDGNRIGHGDGRQRSAAIVPLRTGGKIQGIMPQSIEEVFRMATAIAKSGMAPRDMSSAEKLTVAIMYGLEIGIPPMMAVNKIAVVNGRPTLWGDAIPALLLSRGFKIRESFAGEGKDRHAICVVVRPDGEQIARSFGIQDAITAGLWGKAGPWKQYPDRMLQMRARGLASRDGAADVLSGMYLAEEVQDIPPPRDTTNDLMPQLEATDVPRKSSYKAKQDGTDVPFNELRGAISGADGPADLQRIRQENDALWSTLPHAWAQLVQAEYDDRMAELMDLGEATVEGT